MIVKVSGNIFKKDQVAAWNIPNHLFYFWAGLAVVKARGGNINPTYISLAL